MFIKNAWLPSSDYFNFPAVTVFLLDSPSDLDGGLLLFAYNVTSPFHVNRRFQCSCQKFKLQMITEKFCNGSLISLVRAEGTRSFKEYMCPSSQCYKDILLVCYFNSHDVVGGAPSCRLDTVCNKKCTTHPTLT